MKTILKILLGIIVVAFCITLSWLVVCGIVALVGICFGFAFSWKIATGIWLVGILLRWIVSAASSHGNR